MCGRYTFTSPPRPWPTTSSWPTPEGSGPAVQRRPGQAVAVVALKSDGERFGLAHLKWGLVPDWADNLDRGIRLINASDDSTGKPTFARLFAAQRCLLLATGFYEWRVTCRRKEPVHFSLTGGGLLAFVGLWSVWIDGTRKVPIICLITTPNDLVRDYHDRMPVIVPPQDYHR